MNFPFVSGKDTADIVSKEIGGKCLKNCYGWFIMSNR